VSDAFFTTTATGGDATGLTATFSAAEACVGPWSADAMHGGPPSALLVRACEEVCRRATGLELVALRASMDFLAAVPVGDVEVRARVVRGGRRITLAEAVLVVGRKEVLQARTWLLRTTADDAPAPARAVALAAADPIGRPPEVHHPGPDACPPAMTDWAFPYARALEWRHVAGDPGGRGDAAAWARQRIPILDGETPSGMQRAVLVADSGNGISAALDWDRWSFVNVDLVVHLSRALVGEWVLLDARTHYEPGGTGLATSVLHDESGVVGTGAQSLLVSRLAGTT
jgi:acyl-coenzyme A thioesterase PaaI-like protein